MIAISVYAKNDLDLTISISVNRENASGLEHVLLFVVLNF